MPAKIMAFAWVKRNITAKPEMKPYNQSISTLADIIRGWRMRPLRLSLVDALLLAWILGMIALPILLWTVGQAALPWSITINVMLLASAMTLVLYQAWGLAKTTQTVAIVLLLTWLLEYVGSTTGLPFGAYEYTARFQPQLGHVPLIIPLAWLMMLPPAWAVAQLIAGGRMFGYLLASAGAFTAWDFFLDPQMVAWGVWMWNTPGGYFGIPWQNFAGWALGAFLLTLLARPQGLPPGRPLFVYGATWFLQSFGLWLFWDMPGPALVGALMMGGFLGTAFLRLRSTNDPTPLHRRA
jgi:lycopene beta-cyclase